MELVEVRSVRHSCVDGTAAWFAKVISILSDATRLSIVVMCLDINSSAPAAGMTFPSALTSASYRRGMVARDWKVDN